MTLDQRTLLVLIDQIYEAALDPSRWPLFLETFSEAFRGQTMLFSYDLRNGDANITACTLEETFVRSYLEHYGKKNLFFEKAKHLGVGVLVSKDGNFQREEYEGSEFYNEWVMPQGFFEFGGTKLHDNHGVIAAIAVHRGKRPGALNSLEIEYWMTLMPHLQRAIQVHRRLFSATLHGNSALEALDRLAVGIILTAQDGRVLFCNSVAEQILRAGHGLRVVSGRLCGETPHSTHVLERMIQEVGRTSMGKGTHPGGIVPVPSASEVPLPVLISPVRSEDRLLRQLSGAAAMVLVADPQQKRGPQGRDLMRVYGLTQAEARLLTGLVSGLSLAEHAQGAGVGVATVRSQLKQVFAKTGEHRQSDLIRRVLTDPVLGQLKNTRND